MFLLSTLLYHCKSDRPYFKSPSTTFSRPLKRALKRNTQDKTIKLHTGGKNRECQTRLCFQALRSNLDKIQHSSIKSTEPCSQLPSLCPIFSVPSFRGLNAFPSVPSYQDISLCFHNGAPQIGCRTLKSKQLPPAALEYLSRFTIHCSEINQEQQKQQRALQTLLTKVKV